MSPERGVPVVTVGVPAELVRAVIGLGVGRGRDGDGPGVIVPMLKLTKVTA